MEGSYITISVEVSACGRERSFFYQLSGSAQRRYEAMPAYFVDQQLLAQRVADQFGYSTASSVHQMAMLSSVGADAPVRPHPRPGPRGPVKATGPLREKVISLRARRSVTEIARILTAEGTRTVWKICAARRMLAARRRRRLPWPRHPAGARPGSRPPGRPCSSPMDLPCDHAGLLLLAQAMTELHLHDLIAGCGYPRHQPPVSLAVGWHAAAGRGHPGAPRPPHRQDHRRRRPAFFLGLTALPKATHLSTYPTGPAANPARSCSPA